MNWTKIHIQSDAEPDLTPNSLEVLKRRYLAKDETGATSETPVDMFSRIARLLQLLTRSIQKMMMMLYVLPTCFMICCVRLNLFRTVRRL